MVGPWPVPTSMRPPGPTATPVASPGTDLWAGGRSLTATEAARALGLAALDPAALAKLSAERLAYAAPEAPPPTPKPDYKYMQPDKKRRRHRKR